MLLVSAVMRISYLYTYIPPPRTSQPPHIPTFTVVPTKSIVFIVVKMSFRNVNQIMSHGRLRKFHWPAVKLILKSKYLTLAYTAWYSLAPTCLGSIILYDSSPGPQDGLLAFFLSFKYILPLGLGISCSLCPEHSSHSL